MMRWLQATGMLAGLVLAGGCSDNATVVTTDAAVDGGATDSVVTDVHLPVDVPPGTDVPPATDGVVTTDGGGCTLPDGGIVAVGGGFSQHCPGSGFLVGCTCMADGSIHCDPGCPMLDGGTDAGTDAAADTGSPGSDGGVCVLGDGGMCASGSTCTLGICPDGVTPVTCLCRNGALMFCTGGCPPAVDAGH